MSQITHMVFHDKKEVDEEEDDKAFHDKKEDDEAEHLRSLCFWVHEF